MAGAQAAAAAAAVLGRGGGGGSAFTARSGSNNAAISSSSAQRGCSAKPRSGASMPMQQESISISNLFGSHRERTSSRSLTAVAGENAHFTSATKLEVALVEKEEVSTVEGTSAEPTPEASISAFMADVVNLVKLVDSRDIVELELKQKDYEIIIRKESPQPSPAPMTFPGPHVMAHTSFPGYAPPPPTPTPVPAAAETSPIAVAPPVPPPAKPSHPPMLSPMAGTFYRSPGPGESAFVQVGDKVTKGQVVCIVEAMKLMNEIEADQSGIIVEILAEDGKPISMEAPLFSIKP